MYDHTPFYLHVTRSDIRQHVKLAVSLVSADGHLIFLRGLCRHIPGLSDQRPSLIVAHGLLFGSFLPNRSPWASIWRKHCYDVLERNCQIKAHGPVFRKSWYWRYVAKWSIKNYCWQDNCNSSC